MTIQAASPLIKDVRQIGPATLYLADCRAVLPMLSDVDVVLTDPPYSSGGLHRRDRVASPVSKYISTGQRHLYLDFEGDNRDQRSYGFWLSGILALAHAASRPGAMAAVFSDWRQVPVSTDAFQAAGFTWRGLVSWDKTLGCRPQPGRYRAQCEYLVWGSRGPWSFEGAPAPGAFTHSPMTGGRKLHPTAKPVPLIRDLLSIAPAGALVLDPFMGAGAIGVAAVETGRRYIGIEIDPHYFEIAADRLAGAADG
ncbi:DNA methyltransferase (plasmid) [Tistrella mobilis]|uniref:DNA-methyltransferase n=1 Tax=Tistrella mobilis TaxID=171437 RepID=UPI003558F0A0